jgi:uracil-DNA glycosylase
MKRYELSDVLFNNIHIVEPYPNMVQPVTKMVNITGFFPGGRGLWLEENSTKFPNIMVLGQDFSSVKEYIRWAEKAVAEIQSPTWRNLIVLFKEVGIDLNECFFSNVFMGLRDTDKETGKFPGFKDRNFIKRNLEYLQYQIDIVSPDVIITLGKFAAELLSKLSETDLEDWNNYKALRIPNIGLKTNVHFKGHICSCVALEHTSMRNSNVKRRRYKNSKGEYQGNTAEVEMLKDALRLYRVTT